MNKTNSNSKLNWLFFAVLVAGIAARLLVATCGHDYDMDSWQLVANLADRGDNVYASTDRCLIPVGRTFGPAGRDLTESLFTASFILLGAKRGSVGDKRLVR